MRTKDRPGGNTKGKRQDNRGPLNQNQRKSREETGSQTSRGATGSSPDKHGGSGTGRQQGGSGAGRER